VGSISEAGEVDYWRYSNFVLHIPYITIDQAVPPLTNNCTIIMVYICLNYFWPYNKIRKVSKHEGRVIIFLCRRRIKYKDETTHYMNFNLVFEADLSFATIQPTWSVMYAFSLCWENLRLCEQHTRYRRGLGQKQNFLSTRNL